jgi:hypothetical protein
MRKCVGRRDPQRPFGSGIGEGPGEPLRLATDEIFTMDPPPERAIAGTTAFMPGKQPYWSIWMCRRQSASSLRWVVVPGPSIISPAFMAKPSHLSCRMSQPIRV